MISVTCQKLVASALMTIGFVAAARSSPPVIADETETVGYIPRLLQAVGDRNARYYETDLGNTVADAARTYLTCDVAIICGGDLSANLYPGEVSYSDLSAVFSEDRRLAVTTITINDLHHILEAGLSHITIDESEKIDGRASAYDGFPQISGFSLRYDASAPPGKRVMEIKINGVIADLSDETTTITLAATEYMLNGGYNLPAVNDQVPQDMTLSSVTARYIRDGMAGDTQKDHRINLIGADNNGILSIMPTQYILMIPLLFIVAYFSTGKNRRKEKDIIK